MSPRRAPTANLEAIGTLTAGLAHEIRNPLNGALLHLRVLERALSSGAVTPDAQRALETIDRELKRLSALVDEFLEFAKARPIHLAATDIQSLCEGARLEVAGEAEAAGVALLLDPPKDALRADVDAERLTSAIVCLARNGIEALAGAGKGGQVVLRWRADGAHLRIDVEDDGPGIGRPDEPIFDVFYSSKSGGTGLGLPIAHRIVTDHGGELSVETVPGATTFRMLLPLRPAQ